MRLLLFENDSPLNGLVTLSVCAYVCVLFQVGCDRSSALVQICAERGFHAFVSDALNVPLRTASCDACISIAVIHHFSTEVHTAHPHTKNNQNRTVISALFRKMDLQKKNLY